MGPPPLPIDRYYKSRGIYLKLFVNLDNIEIDVVTRYLLRESKDEIFNLSAHLVREEYYYHINNIKVYVVIKGLGCFGVYIFCHPVTGRVMLLKKFSHEE